MCSDTRPALGLALAGASTASASFPSLLNILDHPS